MTSPHISKLLQRPLVEIRRGFVLGYAPPLEKSAVIALTAPSGKYVDIRVPKDPVETSKMATVMMSAYNLSPNVYATSGVLTSEIPSPDANVSTTVASASATSVTACLVHSTWTHHIDSSGAIDSTDGADMLLLANGEVLEVGVIDVHNGKGAQMFKEFWVYPDVTGWPYIVVETVLDGHGGEGKTSTNYRGMVIRIGPYCQGVLQTPDEFWLERWRQPEKGTGEWTRDACSAVGSKTGCNREKSDKEIPLPCYWACDDGIRKLDETVELHGRMWRVTEIGP